MIINWIIDTIIAITDYCKPYLAQIGLITLIIALVLATIAYLIYVGKKSGHVNDIKFHLERFQDRNGWHNTYESWKSDLSLFARFYGYYIRPKDIGLKSFIEHSVAARNSIQNRIDWIRSESKRNEVGLDQASKNILEKNTDDVVKKLNGQIGEILGVIKMMESLKSEEEDHFEGS